MAKLLIRSEKVGGAKMIRTSSINMTNLVAILRRTAESARLYTAIKLMMMTMTMIKPSCTHFTFLFTYLLAY